MPAANNKANYRSKLGPIPPDDWDNDPPYDPDTKEDTSAGSLYDKIRQRAEKARAGKKGLKFNPDQPRHPAGVSEGGQFAPADGGGGTATAGKYDAKKVEAAAKAGVALGASTARQNGMTPLKGSQGHPALISSADVTAKGASRDVYNTTSVKQMEKVPALYNHNVGLHRDANFYPNFRGDDLKGSTADQVKTIEEHMTANMRFLYSDEVQKAAGTNTSDGKIWYDGARIMVNDRSKEHGYNDASVAGCYAALSPRTQWDKNVYMADRVMDIYAKQQDHAFDDKMKQAISTAWKKPEDQQYVMAHLQGKKLSELANATEKAMWIRTYDEAHSDRNYRIVNADGTLGDYAKTKEGALAKVGWGTTKNISNAVASLEAKGDREKISELMGDRNKVRSFYNNILDPHSPNNDVTVDTHQIGACLLRQIGEKDAALYHALGTGPKKPIKGFEGAKTSIKNGIGGTYPIYADAVRKLANELKIEPRQLQSVVWETKRKLFSDEFGGGVSVKRKKAIEAAWRAYHDDPKMTLAQVQHRVLEICKGGKKWTS